MLFRNICAIFYLMASLSVADAAPVAIPAPSGIDAAAYILEDLNSARVLAEYQADERIEPASITKIMTVYVVFDALKQGLITLQDKVKISEKAWRNPGVSGWMQSSRMFAVVGSSVVLEDLVRGLVIQSGNDAAIALTEHLAKSEENFVAMMNEYAGKLGMPNTHFMNSTGWPDPEHYSTARDISLLTKRLIADFPDYYRYFSEKSFTYNNITQQNRNTLLWQDSAVDGVKTGHTEKGGYSLSASAQRAGMRLITVVIAAKSSQSRSKSSINLLNHGFRYFETNRLYEAGSVLREQFLADGDGATLQMGLPKAWYVTVPKGMYDQMELKMDVQKSILAPVMLNQELGKLYVSIDGKVISETPLLALNEVSRGNIIQRLFGRIRGLFE